MEAAVTVLVPVLALGGCDLPGGLGARGAACWVVPQLTALPLSPPAVCHLRARPGVGEGCEIGGEASG